MHRLPGHFVGALLVYDSNRRLWFLEGRGAVGVAVDAVKDALQGVFLAQGVEAVVLACIGGCELRVLQRSAAFAVGGDGVAHFLHNLEEFLPGQRGGDGPVNVAPDHLSVGRLAVLFGGIEGVILSFALCFFDYGQPMLPAESVRDLTHLAVVRFAVVELVAVPEGNGIDYKVVVVDPCVTVGRHNHLKPFPPELFRKLDADGMGRLRVDLSRLEGLVAVVAQPAVILPPQLFRINEIPCGGLFPAVQAGHILPALRLRIVGGVFQNSVDDVHGGVFIIVFFRNLLWISNVVDDLIQSVFDRPDRRDCHRNEPPRLIIRKGPEGVPFKPFAIL